MYKDSFIETYAQINKLEENVKDAIGAAAGAFRNEKQSQVSIKASELTKVKTAVDNVLKGGDTQTLKQSWQLLSKYIKDGSLNQLFQKNNLNIDVANKTVKEILAGKNQNMQDNSQVGQNQQAGQPQTGDAGLQTNMEKAYAANKQLQQGQTQPAEVTPQNTEQAPATPAQPAESETVKQIMDYISDIVENKQFQQELTALAKKYKPKQQ